jgi:hypothetical protein
MPKISDIKISENPYTVCAESGRLYKTIENSGLDQAQKTTSILLQALDRERAMGFDTAPSFSA